MELYFQTRELGAEALPALPHNGAEVHNADVVQLLDRIDCAVVSCHRISPFCGDEARYER